MRNVASGIDRRVLLSLTFRGPFVWIPAAGAAEASVGLTEIRAVLLP